MIDILKPGRYINHEWNSVHKEWRDDMLKFAICFPDIYEIGMSYLGIRIIYGILNAQSDIICERVFAPWKDMEQNLRIKKQMLVSLESQKPLKEFDIIGFSLQYELNYVDVLNILDLGAIPIHNNERNDTHPLVIAGGPCAFNPEVMADFIDAFVIGEGEEVVLEIIPILKNYKLQITNYKQITNPKFQRDAVLKEIAEIGGVYVPRFTLHASRFTIKKRIVEDLDNLFFPTAPIVPYIQIVHDRIGIEIMRGCPYQCRFCQACRISYPLRIRSVERILEIAEHSVRSTGYEEISLLSLSTGDYPYLEELVLKLRERLKNLGVKVSLPSLRAGSFRVTENWELVKRAGLTFAPEAGSDRLRSYLNKNMDNEDLIQKSNLALKSGWRKVKLYFMIGLPTETYEDIDAIVKLASQISNGVTLSISPFIPKPHSAFENENMDGLGALVDKIAYLKAKSIEHRAKKGLKVDFQSPQMSRIEAVISRGDRAVGKVVYRAWQKGARLQAWRDCFDYRLWEESFEECGVDPENYLKRKEKEGRLPWSFIKT